MASPTNHHRLIYKMEKSPGNFYPFFLPISCTHFCVNHPSHQVPLHHCHQSQGCNCDMMSSLEADCTEKSRDALPPVHPWGGDYSGVFYLYFSLLFPQIRTIWCRIAVEAFHNNFTACEHTLKISPSVTLNQLDSFLFQLKLQAFKYTGMDIPMV